MPRWGNRAAKIAIIIVVLCAVGGTGWLAGHGAANPETPPDTLPAVNLTPQVIDVAEGEIVSRLTVDATVQADPPVEVRPEHTGIVTAIYRKDGQRVNKGENLMSVKSEGTSPSPPGPSPSPGGTETKAPKPVTRVIRATASGRVTGMTAHVGQEVSPSAAVASIDQGRFKAVAPINAKEIYKLYTRPKSIKLAIDHGPSPFSCKLLSYGAEPGAGSPRGGGDSGGGPGGPDGGGPGGDSSDSGVQVSCRVPRRHKVFAGVRGKMSIITDSVARATVVPLSAVLGESQTGQVTVVTKDGKHEIRKVKLGINDGTQIQIVDGLEPGEKILDRAPKDPAFTGPPRSDSSEGPPGFVIPNEGRP